MGDATLVMDETTRALLKGIDEKLGKVDTLEAKLQEIDGRLVATVEKPEDKGDDAKLAKDGPLENVAKMEVWDIPVGQALIGGFSAVFVSELIDGFMVNQSATTQGLVKLVGAGVTIKWGSRLLGKTGATAAALILAYDGIRQLLPLDEWASRLAGGIKSRTGGGLGGRAGMDNVNKQADRVVGDYYSRMKG